MIWKSLLFILLVALVSSCSPKKVSTTPVKLKLFRSSLATGVAVNGGVVLVGKSSDGADSFRIGLANINQDISLDLKKGRWEFAAISWNGDAGLLTGINRCAAATADLKDAEATVTFNMNQTRCLSPFGSSNSLFSDVAKQVGGGSFFKLQPVFCINATLNSGLCSTGVNPTVYKSYKIRFPQERTGGVTGALSDLVSSCHLVSGTADMTLPLGVAGENSSFGFRVELYPNVACGSGMVEMNFPLGIARSIVGDTTKTLEGNAGAFTTYLFLNTGVGSIAANNVVIAGGGSHINSEFVNITFDALLPDVQDVCFTETNSASSCSAGDWSTTLTPPKAFTLSAGDGLKTVYAFTRTAGMVTSLVGQDSITVDKTLPTFGGLGTYSTAYKNFPINLNWPAYSDTDTNLEYDVYRCSSAACSSGCSLITTALNTTSFALASLPSDGSYSICVTAVDRASNVTSKSHVGSFIYDTIAPVASSMVLNSGVNYASNSTLSYTINSVSGADYVCFNEVASTAACSWNAYAGPTGSYGVSVSNGVKQVYAHLKDNAGNISSYSDTITLDTMPPVTPTAGTLGAYYRISDLPMSINWGQSIDANLEKYNFMICTDSACSINCSPPKTTAGTVTNDVVDNSDVTLEGTNYVCVQGIDLAGNGSNYAMVSSFNYDNIAPVVSGLSLTLASGASYTNTQTINWSITGSFPGDLSGMCFMSTASPGGCAWSGVASSGTWTLPAGDGTKNVYVFFKDDAGNVSSAIYDYITLDMTPPSAFSIVSPNIPTDVEGSVVKVNFTASSDAHFEKYQARLCDMSNCAGTLYGTADFVSGATDGTISTGAWPMGTTAYIVMKAIDMAGNATTNVVSADIKRVIHARVKQVVAGYDHTCALLSNGKLKCWGQNTYGQLGTGSMGGSVGNSLVGMGDNLPPVNFGGGFDINQIALGSYFSCALSNSGVVKCWGANSGGNLGQGNTTSLAMPTDVDVGAEKPIQIATGSNHVCIVTETGKVKCWGANSYGQLGIGSTTTIGNAGAQMGANLISVNLGTNEKAVKVVAAGESTCALLSNRQIKCWGRNNFGQLGQGTSTNIGTSSAGETYSLQVVNLGTGEAALDVVLSTTHACALLTSGNMKCWGENSSGQLGYGDTVGRGSVGGQMGDNLPAINLGSSRKAIKIAVGTTTSCAALDDGNARCWGENGNGAAGVGSTTDIADPSSSSDIDVGLGNKVNSLTTTNEIACAVLFDGRLKCWGKNNTGRLGIGTSTTMGITGGQMGDDLPYVALGTALKIDVIKTAKGADHTCALMYNGLVKCWGANYDAELGLNAPGITVGTTMMDMGANLPFIDFGGAHFVRDIASGGADSHSSCAIMADGELKCWGKNDAGQLGIGNNSGSFSKIGDEAGEVASAPPVDFSGLKIRSVAMAFSHTCALAVNGNVFCFGGNVNGQLGYNSTASLLAPAGAVNLLSDKVIQIALGGTHSCALLSTGLLKCWGSNLSGELGQNNLIYVGNGGGTNMSSLTPIVVDANAKVLSVDAGLVNTCALLDNHTVKCWGSNIDGVLGQNNSTDIGSNGGNTVVAAAPVNFVTNAADSLAIDVKTNGYSTCVLRTNGKIRCWGNNNNGILGQNNNTASYGTAANPVSTIIDAALANTTTVSQLTLGGVGTCGVSWEGHAFCWGSNSYGQAGRGSNTTGFGTSGSQITGGFSPIDL